jgi:hypothetical protein
MDGAVMKEVPMKAYWMGEDIDTLPRERLIEIVHELSRQLEVMQEAMRLSARVVNAMAGRKAA